MIFQNKINCSTQLSRISNEFAEKAYIENDIEDTLFAVAAHTLSSTEVEHASTSSYISKLYITQNRTNSWTDKGKTFYRYKVELKNGTPHTLLRLQLLLKNLEGPLWGLTKEGEEEEHGVHYTFPPWLHSLSSGEILTFVYIHSDPKAAKITVTAAALI